MSDWPDEVVERVAAAFPFADQASKERLALQALNALGGERVLAGKTRSGYDCWDKATWPSDKHRPTPDHFHAMLIPLEGGDVGD